MTYRISSEIIDNPLLIELLKKLKDCFDEIGMPFYVIGATARDIIMLQLTDITSHRKTKDPDIAIAIPDRAKFEEISKTLQNAGLKKSLHQRQRFYMGNYELDVVPFLVGGIRIAYDLVQLLSAEQCDYYGNAIQQEIDRGETSKVINQIIEYHSSLSRDLVLKTWREMANIFKQRAKYDDKSS